MVEVLVSILVLSLGLLGMLGVILNSFKLTSTSNYRTVAASQAYAMADSLRASVPALDKYNDPDATADSNCIGADAAGCTDAKKMVDTEMHLWLGRLGAMLPSGDGIVCRDADDANDGDPTNWQCSGAGPYVIKVCWDESRVAGVQTGDWQCVRTNL